MPEAIIESEKERDFMTELRKYPRTPHLEGSRLQPGDEDLSQIRFKEIAGRHLVIEEKLPCPIPFRPSSHFRPEKSRAEIIKNCI